MSSLSSVHRAFLRGYLRVEKKIELDKVPWRFVSVDAGNMITALITDQIDGFLHSEPTTTLAIVNKAGHLFMQAARGDMGPNPPPNSFLTTRRNFLAQSPDVVRRFLLAIFDANRAYEAARDQMIPVMSDWSGMEERVILAAIGKALGVRSSNLFGRANNPDNIGTSSLARKTPCKINRVARFLHGGWRTGGWAPRLALLTTAKLRRSLLPRRRSGL